MEEQLDIQVQEAEADIKHSHEIIARLQTLDKRKFPFLDSLIGFHELRIKNCSDAIQKFLASQSQISGRIDKHE